MKSLISADVDYCRDGFQTGALRIPFSSDRSGYGHIPVPVAVLKRGSGPTVLFTGGNHGDEYEGPIALMKLIQRMPSMDIRGTLIVIPGLNFPAFLNGTRTSPIDKANLNRVFPGSRNGGPTEMIAHYLDTELFPRADFIFDIHAGGASTNYLPLLMIAPPADAGRRAAFNRLVHAFASPRVIIMDLLGEDRTYGAAAERHNVLFFCGEFGGGSSCNLEGLALVEGGIQRLLHALGMTDDDGPLAPTTPSRHLRVDGERHYVFSPCPGIFEPAFRLGDEVVTGQLAGRLHDPYRPTNAPLELRFKGEGLVVCIRTFSGVQAGDCLVHLASDIVDSEPGKSIAARREAL
ncbi:succinylglutamate desuccinylase [Allopusillimonas soli]|uniref:Succinylglutamate desuccinylase/aspartoacylase family protein n=1 Tax=Allopusillimonas soli TaxID=659016 RepID=A0A853FGK4_9BURK|nr:succinylglutamate desuccinylase/aspartoacylase family protein [Allopusillimonas soli]NYT38828.1 succinylglutamate desuccinylase/aspartoacylase family protein [Allopusillimonas soli]TEA70196.1 succinylglutamate desuccinylase [Allopusillimonas soli]